MKILASDSSVVPPTKPRKKQASRRSTRAITTRHELLGWLFQQLEQAEPLVPVSEAVVAAKQECLELIRDGEFIDIPPISWDEIFHQIQWERQADPKVERCGASLLSFLGTLGAAIERNIGAKTSRTRAIEMLLDCWADSTSYFVFRLSGDQRWVETSPLGVRDFGLEIRVDVSHGQGTIANDLWNLSVPFRRKSRLVKDGEELPFEL